MARLQAEIIQQQEIGTALWRVLRAANTYVLLYRGEPFNLLTESIFGATPKKYKKTTYTNEGSARARVRELNAMFNTMDFTYQCIGRPEDQNKG